MQVTRGASKTPKEQNLCKGSTVNNRLLAISPNSGMNSLNTYLYVSSKYKITLFTIKMELRKSEFSQICENDSAQKLYNSTSY